MTDLVLPAGYTARPVQTADVSALHALVQTCDQRLHGYAESDADEIRAVLGRPGLDPATDTVLVTAPDGTVAAWAWMNRRSDADVHPAHRGRGIGTGLLNWIEHRAGSAVISQTVPDGDHAATGLLRSHGWTPMVTSWQLAIAFDEPPVVDAPGGITLRPFQPGDEQDAYVVLEDAFDEWQQRRKSYEEWAMLTVGRDAFDPARSVIATDGGQLVGVLLALDLPGIADGYIERLAVRADHRGRGLAQALLRACFAAYHAAGRRSCVVWTHSDTGALGVYERAGMTVRRSSTVYRNAPEPS
ncbi:GNAT family N-acetyltransferase [Hamadaea sp. NPDC051192]|uniref:GNAT family N-acetyltransferase n=1 Tax=Hamadaea sp. NPDC051192 TaxID=3154940 RepID=UPI003435729E